MFAVLRYEKYGHNYKGSSPATGVSCLYGVHAVTHLHVQKRTQHLQQLQEYSEEVSNL